MNERGYYGNAGLCRRRTVTAGDPQYLPAYRNAAWVAVRKGLRVRKVPALGYWRQGIHEKTYLFSSVDQARSWYQQLAPGYDYAAIFDARDPAHPLADNVGDQQAPADQVGASIFQTPGGIQSELSDINEDFLRFSKEITNEIERRGYPTKPGSENDPVVKIFVDAWTPLIQGWQAFYANNKGWWHNFWWNEAPNAEAWQRKLIELRDTAKRAGMGVVSVAPEPYSRSALDPHHDIIDTTKDVFGDVGKILKYGVIGMLAIGGVVLLSSAAQNLRSGRDPAEKYVQIIRERRSRAPLPRARALPPGEE
jgi:hypothetical protein